MAKLSTLHGRVSNYCYVFLVAYLTTLSVSRLYSVDDTLIKECGAVVGMSIEGGKRSARRKKNLS
jgi:hypothetical protein